MKTKISSFLNRNGLGLLAIIGALAIVSLTGCAHVVKKSETGHDRVIRAVALPPGWTLVAASDSLNLPLAESAAWAGFANANTNFPAGIFAPRPVAFTVIDERWTDYSRGGGTFLFTDPQGSQINSSVSNESALAGGHQFGVGIVSSTIPSNAVSAITAGTSGVGNITGAAATAASGTP